MLTRELALVASVWGGVAAVFLLAELAVGGLGPSIDDGWIYLSFARSVAAGEGMTYDGYDGPVAAITGPAWLAILAGVMVVVGPSMWVLKGVAALAGLAGALSAGWLGHVASGRRSGVALGVGLVVACTGRYGWGAMSLMEVPLCVGATCAGLALHLERRRRALVAWAPALLVLAVAGWSRPECFAFVAFATLDRVRCAARWTSSGVGRTLLLATVVLALYPLFHLWVYGHPLPTTFYAKAGGGAPWRTAAESGVVAAVAQVAWDVPLQVVAFFSWGATHAAPLFIGLLTGLVTGWRRKNCVPLVFAALLFFAMARGFLGYSSPGFQHSRYYAQLWPLMVVVCVAGFAPPRVHAFKWRTAVPLAAVVMLFVALILDAPATLLATADWPLKRAPGSTGPLTALQNETLLWVPFAVGVFLAFAGAVVAVVAPRKRADLSFLAPAPPTSLLGMWLVVVLAANVWQHGHNVLDTRLMSVAMGEAVREKTEQGAVIACHDVGALGWFAQRELIDLAGLTSPEVTFLDLPEGGYVLPTVLERLQPEYLCVLDDWMARLNSGRVLPKGFIRPELIHEIVRPENFTLSGDRYVLIRLVWED